MHCPVCKDPKLVITERQGIEIDYCPDCRGVWLDRGELDKLIEKSLLRVHRRRSRQPMKHLQRLVVTIAMITNMTSMVVIERNRSLGLASFLTRY